MPEAVSSSATGKTLGDSEAVHKACDELEADIAGLKAAYEQFFLGVERKPPNLKHDAVKKKLLQVRNVVVRQVAAKFRVQNLAQKLATYERLWARTLKEMEEGTYRRDVFKARLHAEKRKGKKKDEKKAAEAESEDVDMDDFGDEGEVPSTPPDAEAARGVQPHGAKPAPPQVASGSKPGVAAKAGGPAVPAPGARSTDANAPGGPAVPAPGGKPSGPAVPAPGGRPSGPGFRVPVSGPQPAVAAKAPVAAQGDLSDQKIKAIYDAYVTAKKRCNEDVSKLSIDSLASTLRKQVPDLMKQHGAKSVEFKVVIKDGKAILRALPK